MEFPFLFDYIRKTKYFEMEVFVKGKIWLSLYFDCS